MEIIAALIIACSNLVQPYGSSLRTLYSDDVINLKKACIARVAKCAETNSTFGSIQNSVTLKICTKEIY